MTPQYILRRSLCREPHCFSAHVPGQGYVNNGTDLATRADYIAQYVRAAESEIENMGFASSYAEPGYSDPAKGILFADWNRFPRGVDDVLEAYGYALEWSDEWSTCEDCGKAFRTSPDSYGWRPSYALIGDCSLLCVECVGDSSEYLDSLINDPQAIDQFDTDLGKHGFSKVNADSFENGFHPGQNDTPADIVAKLPTGVDYVFQLDDKGQFDIKFSIWTRPQETEEE